MLREEEQEPEPQKNIEETKQVEEEDAELIFVGVEHANEDAELIFVGVTSHSKPVVSNILNRVTPGSYLRRKKYGHIRKNRTHKLQPVSLGTPTSEAVAVLPVSESESRSTDSPIIIDEIIYIFILKSSKHFNFFVISAFILIYKHFSSYYPYFNCSVANMWPAASILDREGQKS